MALSLKQMQEIIDQISHPEFIFNLRFEDIYNNFPYLQITCEDICNVTGESIFWSGRKWKLSYHMTPGEIVQTALKASLTAAEHECRESFKYKGVTIFDPHIDLDKLVDERIKAGLKGRD